MKWTLAQVAAGGAIGASARYLTGMLAMRLFGPGFPIGTLTVNVVGSFLMGVIVVALARYGGTHRLGPFLTVGFLGGFTTFSSFSLDAVTLYERGAVAASVAYVFLSVLLSLAALFSGLTLTRAVLA